MLPLPPGDPPEREEEAEQYKQLESHKLGSLAKLDELKGKPQ
jgi:hypothetical protein